MADEITVGTGKISCRNGNFIFDAGNQTLQVTQTVQGGGGPGKVSIPTTAGGTAVSLGTFTNYGWAYIRNLDATNYVTYGPDSGGSMIPFGKLKAGEGNVFRLVPGITLRVLANTATCLVQVHVLED